LPGHIFRVIDLPPTSSQGRNRYQIGGNLFGLEDRAPKSTIVFIAMAEIGSRRCAGLAYGLSCVRYSVVENDGPGKQSGDSRRWLMQQEQSRSRGVGEGEGWGKPTST
jgi:hypothetical protein